MWIISGNTKGGFYGRWDFWQSNWACVRMVWQLYIHLQQVLFLPGFVSQAVKTWQ